MNPDPQLWKYWRDTHKTIFFYLNSGIVVGGISGAPVEQGQRLLIHALHPFMLHKQKTSICQENPEPVFLKESTLFNHIH
jgi:hypothetical protein